MYTLFFRICLGLTFILSADSRLCCLESSSVGIQDSAIGRQQALLLRKFLGRDSDSAKFLGRDSRSGFSRRAERPTAYDPSGRAGLPLGSIPAVAPWSFRHSPDSASDAYGEISVSITRLEAELAAECTPETVAEDCSFTTTDAADNDCNMADLAISAEGTCQYDAQDGTECEVSDDCDLGTCIDDVCHSTLDEIDFEDCPLGSFDF